MKIGLVCPYNIAKGGGVQEIVRAMQRELIVRGHTAKILTPEPRELSDYQRPHNVIFVGGAADYKSPFNTTAQFSVTSDMDGIEQMLEEEQFDILHFHEPWVPMLSRQILSRSQSVNIATFHAKLPETMLSRTVARVITPYTKAVLRNLDELTAVSEAAAEFVRSLTESSVTIIPNGIDLSVYRTPKIKPGLSEPKARKTLLFIGRLERRKGVNCLLEAYGLLSDKMPDVELLIAGDGPDRKKLESNAHDMQLPNVHFLGYVSEAEKIKLLASADLFVAPALYGESFGIVLLEAMASGLVTVAGNNPGYTAVLQELGSLSLVNPKDPAEFARRMDIMLHDEELRRIWKKWAKLYIKQFAYTNIVDQYLDVYTSAHKLHAVIPELA